MYELPHIVRLFADMHDEKDFYNYFQYGLDFLITGPEHIVTKIILHTNVVGRICSFIEKISLIPQ